MGYQDWEKEVTSREEKDTESKKFVSKYRNVDSNSHVDLKNQKLLLLKCSYYGCSVAFVPAKGLQSYKVHAKEN